VCMFISPNGLTILIFDFSKFSTSNQVKTIV
jgi:hypothetical protein